MFGDTIYDLLGNDNNVNEYIDTKLKKIYPDIISTDIDKDLLENIILNLIDEDCKNNNNNKNNITSKIVELSNNNNNTNINNNTDKIYNNFNEDIIKENILMADEIIPEMSISSNLIHLKGKLNGIDIKIMVDTGASSCVIFKSTLEKCGLEYLIDTNTSVMVQGAHGIKPSLGTIWYIEVELEICKENMINVPITVEVIDDTESINANKIIQENYDKIKKNICKDDDITTNKNTHSFEIILGMSFLKSYRANIDFSTMTITLNKNIKIKFD